MTDQTPRSLADRITEDYAPAWRPEPGQSIIGFVTEISMGTSDYGDYPIVTITTQDGARASIHAFHTVVKDALIDAEPSIGEEIAVKYNGRTLPKNFEPKKGTSEAANLKEYGYENYRVIVNRAPADVWGKFSKSPNRDDK